jgi:curli biogenesis system outer membrane secretion channel CsgG
MMLSKSILRTPFSWVVFLLLPLSLQGGLGDLFGSKDEETETADESSAVADGLPPYTGVKHAVGVSSFRNEAGWEGRWELGRNLAMMLESALADTGRFVIVDRRELDAVIGEQDLQASGRAAESSEVAQTGLLRSARYLADGSVTRVDYNTAGDSGGIGFGGIRVGRKSNEAEIELVVRLVDTTSGEVVASQRISGKAGGQRLNLSFRRSGVSGGMSDFSATPIGEAAQDCIVQATLFIAQEMEDYEITANVVMAPSPDRIVINRGENYGVAPGQEFLLREAGEILTDPETGEILGVFEGEINGRIEVVRVTEKLAYCKLTEGQKPERGDTVVFAEGQ